MKMMAPFVNKYDQILFLWWARETPLRVYKDLRRHIAENYFIEEFETVVEGRFCTEFRRRSNKEDVQILRSMLKKYTVCFSQKREEMFEIVKCISIAFLKSGMNVTVFSDTGDTFAGMGFNSLSFSSSREEVKAAPNVVIMFGYSHEFYIRRLSSYFELKDVLFLCVPLDKDNVILRYTTGDYFSILDF